MAIYSAPVRRECLLSVAEYQMAMLRFHCNAPDFIL